ncbi:hypothetical protein JXQ31_18725 [candidate division KSB1 bacterium]|nr:hypothetical protein [candidate division KSB1 bacterium]
MKKLYIVFALLIIFSVTTFAGNLNTIENRIKFATEGYLKALKSDNPGIRNSALHQITVLKARYPNINLSRIERQIEKLSRSDKEVLIRVNASIAYKYLKNSELTGKVNTETVDPREFFTELYNQVGEIEKVY